MSERCLSLIPSRESAGKLRHNSHCRDKTMQAIACSATFSSRKACRTFFAYYLGIMKLNAELKAECFFALGFFRSFINRPSGRFSFSPDMLFL